MTVEYVQVRCSGCGETIADPVPLALAASERPIYCDRCSEEHDAPADGPLRASMPDGGGSGEADEEYGGAFDGSSVSSDADPGL